jgi:hypothetical protein
VTARNRRVPWVPPATVEAPRNRRVRPTVAEETTRWWHWVIAAGIVLLLCVDGWN